MTNDRASENALADPDDRAYVASIDEAALRRVVVDSLLRHRVPEQLEAGDEAPDVMLTRPEREPVRLRDLLRGRPVLLIFGSYT